MKNKGPLIPRWLDQSLLHVGNILMVAVILAPVFWMIVTAVLPIGLLMRRPPVLDFSKASFQPFMATILSREFLDALLNSTILSFCTAVISVVGGALGAYALARYRFRGKNSMLLLLLGTQMAPGTIMVIPTFILLNFFHRLDSYSGLIVVHVAFLSPLVIWLLYGFFKDIPPSLERAARMDGCSRLQALRLIVAPLSVNGLVAAAIFCFISTWASFLFPLVLSIRRLNLPIMISRFTVLYDLDFGKGARYGVLVALPVVLVTLLAQRYIMKGIVEGAVKQ